MLDFWFQHTLPVPLAEQQRLRELLAEHASAEQLVELQQLHTDERAHAWAMVVAGSSFSSQWLCRHPSQWLALLKDPDAPFTLPDLPLTLPLDAFDRALREQRNGAMAAIIWRDLNRRVDLAGTTEALTALAEWALHTALTYHYQQLRNEVGEPRAKNGEPQGFYILGLGKLGACELNLSSDVDLMFAYPHKGETAGGPKVLDNQEFFTRLGQRIIKSLDAITSDGFVFRVDMRLRPYGTSGALASSFGALEDYYQTQGREWERFAMIKARIVASNGDAAHAAELMHMLQSFSYRRYVDFSAIDALRNLKQLINREVKRRRLADNIKLGRGGIREVEFIAQAFQLIRGGRDIDLQERCLLKVLPMLERLNCLPEGVAGRLAQSYVFLRNLEHALQALNDEQTQNLPKDDIAQRRLAFVLGFANYAALVAELGRHRSYVSEQFQAVIAEPAEDAAVKTPQAAEPWVVAWSQIIAASPAAKAQLTRHGFDEHADALVGLLTDLLASPRVAAMDAPSRKRLDDFMPRLLGALVLCEAPLQVLERLFDLLKAIVRRSAYLVLLSENPGALKQLLTLVAGSPWIGEQLAAHPALLDELLDPATLYHVPSRDDLLHELRQYLLRTPADDLEAQMEGLRYFRSAHALRVAACEITERLPLMRVSDYLTELAEVILTYVLQLAWQQMTARHGYPDGQTREVPNFIIVGYGKLGGIELSHGSDLDLVFIHDANPQGETNGDFEGKKVLDNLTFYIRLGQKIIHILSTQTPGGQLYEVDMRLRPSGNSGLLVTSFNAYQKYQYDNAWTWEHQALVRARALAGDALMCQRFEALRKAVLCQARDPAKLKQDVTEMRKKMRTQLGSNAKEQAAGQFALKQDAGGIVDIEFMVQYAVLAWSQAIPALARFTDNIRILGSLEASGHLESEDVRELIDAYKTFRSLGHRLVLQQRSAVVDAESVARPRAKVAAIWQKLVGDSA